MDAQEQKLNVVLKITNVEIFVVAQNQANSIENGTLSLAEIPEHHSYLLIVGNFKYALSSEMVIMTRKLVSGETIYILPNIEGYYGLRVPAGTNQQQLEVFELILHQTCELLVESDQTPEPQEEVKPEPNPPASSFIIRKAADYNPNATKESMVASKSSGKESRPAVVSQKEKVKTSSNTNDTEEEKTTTTAKVTTTITKSGEVIREGLIKVAEITSDGITKAGRYLSSKFAKKQQNVEVKETTINKIKVAKTTTNAVLVFTSTQIKALISMAGMIGKELNTQWQNTDTAKKLEEKPAYHVAKQIGISAVQATATVYDGMYEALCVLGRGVGKATTEIVTNKYGEKMGEATKGAFDCAGNVGLIAKVIPMEAAKALSSDNSKQIQQ